MLEKRLMKLYVMYSSPVASLVLTDSSQLTSDSQHLGIYLNVDCQKSAVGCQSAPKKPRGYCTATLPSEIIVRVQIEDELREVIEQMNALEEENKNYDKEE
uniref:Uncharacterized protein n=1 Tax=Timema poppense TaxID=170557 RepID=A0A7R9DKV9_TIMPO|nr:unnamed protein product [Timema poppensis]